MARAQFSHDPHEHQAPRYDVAISYSSEDRSHAEALALGLRSKGCRVFLDTLEPLELWGDDVGRQLEEIFEYGSRLVVVLASEHWASRRWTMHERNAIRRRVSREARTVLPVTSGIRHVPGLPDTHGHLDLSLGVDALTTMVCRALEGIRAAGPSSPAAVPATAVPGDDHMSRTPHFHPILQTTVQPSQNGKGNVQKTSTKVTTGISSFGLVSILTLVVGTIGGAGWLALDFVRSQPRDSEGRVEVFGIPVPTLLVGDPADEDSPEVDDEGRPGEGEVQVDESATSETNSPQPAGHITQGRLAGAWRCPSRWVGHFFHD